MLNLKVLEPGNDGRGQNTRWQNKLVQNYRSSVGPFVVAARLQLVGAHVLIGKQLPGEGGRMKGT